MSGGSEFQGTLKTAVPDDTATHGSGDIESINDVIVHGTTNSTSSSTGSIRTAGGIGVAKSIVCDGSITLTNNPLSVGNGGTGLTTVTANRLLFGNGSSALSTSSNLTFASNTLNTPSIALTTPLSVGNGGTGLNTISAGQIPYANNDSNAFELSSNFRWLPSTNQLQVTGLTSIRRISPGSTPTTGTPVGTGQGNYVNVTDGIFTDSNTGASGTRATFYGTVLGQVTLAASNTNVTTTTASTLTIGGAVLAGTNQTIGASYALLQNSTNGRIYTMDTTEAAVNDASIRTDGGITAAKGIRTATNLRVGSTVFTANVVSSMVGIGTDAPTSYLDVRGSVAFPLRHVTTTATAAGTDHVITGDATGGAFTISLPTAAGITGRMYIFKKLDNANNITIQANGVELIDGDNTLVLSTQYETQRIVSNGTKWLII